MRPHPKRTSTNVRSPRAWATCDRSGFITNHEKLVWQYDWAGTQLINKKILVAPDMLDKPQRQLGTIILPADPVSIPNARPEQYTMEETAVGEAPLMTYEEGSTAIVNPDGTFITSGGGAPHPLHPPKPGPPPSGPLAPVSSAGVFDSTGTLVRTIWSAQANDPRSLNPAAAWDGLFDDGTIAPAGSYTVKLLSSDVQYHWDGALANSSSDHTTQFYHNYFAPIIDMAITAAGEMYYATQYNEREPCIRVGVTTDIQNSRPAAQNGFRQGYSNTLFVCSDGTLTYFAVQVNPSSYIVACSTTDGPPVLLCTKTGHNFSSGSAPTFGSFPNVCGLATSGGGPQDTQIAGLAVQQSGSYLFATRPFLSPAQVLTYNKTTGALLQTNTSFTNPQRLAVSPTTGDVWLIHDTAGPVTKIDKYTVDGSGNLVSASVTITGLTAPQALAVSPDGATLLVCDGGTSQTVKAFNTSDGTAKTAFGTSGVFGTVGGYVNSPAVTNTKWMFTTAFSSNSTWIAFAPDGSFWLGDNGNYRSLHFSSGNSPTYVEQIAYMPLFYSQRVVRGAETRVLADWLEFTVDYSKPIAPNNGSWVLSKNWFGNFSPTFMPAINGYSSLTQYNFILNNTSFTRLKFALVASNGRTYAAAVVSAFDMRIFELTSTGLRVCGVIGYAPGLIPLNTTYIDRSFNLWFTEVAGPGQVCNIWKNAFAGFDVNNDPTFADMSGVPAQSQGSIIYTSQMLPTNFSQTWSGDNNLIEWAQTETTASGKIIFWNPDTSDQTPSYRLSAMDSATGNIKWMTHPTNPSNHAGSYIDTNDVNQLLYPDAPAFPLGNRMGANGGGPKHYLPGDSNIFTVFNGENWGSNQTNVISHWHDSGLLVNRFGAGTGANFGQPFLGPYFGSTSALTVTPAQPDDSAIAAFPFSWKALRGFHGNARWGSLVFVNGVYYIHQNDEWYHGGIGRWSVTNTSSIHLTSQDVSWNPGSFFSTPSDPTDLLQGLPYNSTVADGTAGWHRSPATDILNSPTNWLAIFTHVISCDRFKPDLALVANATPATYTLYRDFPAGGTGNWTLSGTMWYGVSTIQANFITIQDVIYIDILDNNGRTILRHYAIEDPDGNGFWFVNGVVAKSVPATTSVTNASPFRYHNQAKTPFSVTGYVGSGVISIVWGDWTATTIISDPLADITNPSRLLLTYSGPNAGFGGSAIVFTKLNWVR